MSAADAGELLKRIARTLKESIGPAIEAEYPRTQAFMASVVLEKLGRELDSASEHRAAEAADLEDLLADLRKASIDRRVTAAVATAIDTLARTRERSALCDLIEALYAARAVIGEADFAGWLGRIRETLRRSIDRRMEVAK